MDTQSWALFEMKKTIFIVIDGVSSLVAAPFLSGNIVHNVKVAAVDTLPQILQEVNDPAEEAFREYFHENFDIKSKR